MSSSPEWKQFAMQQAMDNDFLCLNRLTSGSTNRICGLLVLCLRAQNTTHATPVNQHTSHLENPLEVNNLWFKDICCLPAYEVHHQRGMEIDFSHLEVLWFPSLLAASISQSITVNNICPAIKKISTTLHADRSLVIISRVSPAQFLILAFL